MARAAKYVNVEFLEQESKAMWYIVGISFAQYSTKPRQYETPINRWQSTSKTLIDRVKDALESEHKISPTVNKHNLFVLMSDFLKGFMKLWLSMPMLDMGGKL